MKFLLLITSLSLLLISCDPETSYEQVIENHSSYDIWLINNDPVASSCGELNDSILLQSMSSFFLRDEFGLGNPSVYKGCSDWCLIDSIDTRIEGNSALKLSYPLNVNANWEYEELSKGNSYKCECRLTITDADIN